MPTIILILQSMLCAFGVDFYLPAFPEIEGEFFVTSSDLQYFIGSYTIGALIARLFLPTLINYWGIRRCIIIMSCINIIGQLLCSYSPTFSTLIYFRLISGSGSGALFIISMLLLPNYYSKKIIGYNTGFISFNIGLIIAPLVAVLLLETLSLSWRQLHLFCALAQGILLPFISFIKYPPQKSEKSTIKEIIKSYNHILQSKREMLFIFWGTATVVQYLTYISQIPHVIITTLEYSKGFLSIVLLFSSLSSIIFGVTWNWVLKTANNTHLLFTAILFNFGLLLYSFFLFFISWEVSLLKILIFILFQNITASLVLPLSLAQATSMYPNQESVIISLSSIMRSFFTSIITAFCAIFLIHSNHSLYAIFLFTSLLSTFPPMLLSQNKTLIKET